MSMLENVRPALSRTPVKALTAFLLALILAALCSSIAPHSAFAAQDVYVNGQTGDDAAAGTADAPVRTFAKAKELYQQEGSSAILVAGAMTVSADEAWSLDGGSLKRAPGYTGEFVDVTPAAGATAVPTLSLSDIVMDGGNEDGVQATASLVVCRGGNLTVQDGTTLQNNSISAAKTWPVTGGGAISTISSSSFSPTVEMTGGLVQNNSGINGGGVYICQGTFRMSGGTIQGNHATDAVMDPWDDAYAGVGGGVCLFGASKMYFSGGTIKDNTADYAGGGISVGASSADLEGDDVLDMTGGSLSGNSAGCGGGGLFVQAGITAQSSYAYYGVDSYGVANVSGGQIVGNSMTGTGKGNDAFGGGGVYVNGYDTKTYPDFHNGELNLSNVEVTRNTSTLEGAGYAACPVSSTSIELTKGGVFHENTSTQDPASNEIYILASDEYGTHSGDPTYQISPVMLGGASYHWQDASGEEATLDKLHGTLSAAEGESLSLSSPLTSSDAGVQYGQSLSTTLIADNTSTTRGGGIGSNGTVVIGAQEPQVQFQVTKVWDDDDDAQGERPDTLDFDVLCDGDYVGHQTMAKAADGTWAPVTVSDLPVIDSEGNRHVYTVVEHAVDGYTSTVSGDQDEGFMVTNTLEKPDVVPPTTPKEPEPQPAEAGGQPQTSSEEGQPEEGDQTPETSDAAAPFLVLAMGGLAAAFALAALGSKRHQAQGRG